MASGLVALWPYGHKLYKVNELGNILAVCLNPRVFDWTKLSSLCCNILWSSLVIQAVTVWMINSPWYSGHVITSVPARDIKLPCIWCIQKDTNMLLTLSRLNCHAPGQDTVAQGIIKVKIDHDMPARDIKLWIFPRFKFNNPLNNSVLSRSMIVESNLTSVHVACLCPSEYMTG